ncbi:MAG: exonuclease SbcCD subunit D [Acidobacteria bacterium]|nr:exonuclease SbcCD subunit D [Acidobacteriota bacterium]
MRFLHTADWHIGKSLRGRSRIDEQSQALTEILDIVRREKIDAVLHAGDLFDSFSPHAEAERLVYHFFGDLAKLGIPAVVIGGNHDHPHRLEALRPLLEPLHIHVRSAVKGPQEGGVIQLDIRGEQAHIAVLPFLPEHKLITVEQMMSNKPARFEGYSDRMADIVDFLCAGFSANTVNILLGHLFVMDAKAAGSERPIHLTKPYALSAPRFPTTASYIALGHLHNPQDVPAPSPTRYAGSILQMDFGEEGQSKRVIIVDAAPRKTARMDSIALTSGRRLRSVNANLLEVQQKQKEWNNGDLLRVTIQTEKPQLGLADKVREMLPDAVEVRVELPKLETATEEPLQTLKPEEIFERFYRARNETEMPDSVRQAFVELYEETSRAPR